MKKETGAFLLITICYMAVVLGVCALFTSCRSQKVVTVTEYRDRVQRDTLRKVDSVYVAHYLMQKGDTVWMTDTICQFRILHDTRDVYVHDSVPYPVEVVKEVRTRNAYDRFTARGFWLLCALIVLRVIWWAFKTFYLRR